MRSSRAVKRPRQRPAILVPVDGSSASGRAVAQAVRFARKLRAGIIALHVATPCELALYTRRRPAIVTPEAFTRIATRISERILSAARKRAAAAGVPCVCRTAWQSAVADAIVDAARRERCELIVMATHGHTGLQRMLLGSITQKVLAGSRVPVLVCR